MILNINPKDVLRFLITIISILLICNICSIIIKHFFGQLYVAETNDIEAINAVFNFNEEKSIPTWFSTFTLLIASFLLYIIGISHRKLKESYFPWIVLSSIFLFLSLDEFLSIHEYFIEIFRAKFSTTGLLYYAWIIPYGVALFFIVLALIPFLKNLLRNIRNLFLLSGGLFVLGAIGFESLSGRHIERYSDDIIYALYYTIEESLEMLGVAFFIYALILYISIVFKDNSLHLSHPNKGSRL